jgi:hypothetical protein
MIWGVLSALVQAVLGVLFAAFRVRRQDGERDAALSGRAVDGAALETQEVVNDAVDARASLSAPSADPDDRARELRI